MSMKAALWWQGNEEEEAAQVTGLPDWMDRKRLTGGDDRVDAFSAKRLRLKELKTMPEGS